MKKVICWLVVVVTATISLAAFSWAASPPGEGSSATQSSTRLARWLSGQVLHSGQWQTLEKIEQSVSADPRYQEYQDRVAHSPDTLATHAELARWCRKAGLELEERWHWYNVLRHDGTNREALGALKLRRYQGSYLTAEQIAEVEESAKHGKVAFKKYADELKSAMRAAERSDGDERVAALKKISSITDPTAVPAIVEVVLADARNERRVLSKLGQENGEKLLRAMQQSAIVALTQIPEHVATIQLVDVALYASDAQIRSDAGKALSYREPTSFMPGLMAGLSAPIELSFTISTLPNGQITVIEDFAEAGPLANKKHTRTSTFLTQHINYHTHDNTLSDGRGGLGPTIRTTRVSQVWSEQWRDMANAAAQVLNSREQVDLENELRRERNERIEQVLALASCKELGEDPRSWWNDWKAYNEVSTPEVLPVDETEESYDYSQYYETSTYSSTAPIIERPAVSYSCFIAGTPVWTQAGPVAIEHVRLGDFVLSQNLNTGELSYRPVINTFHTPQSKTLKLSVNHDTIVTTRGHRFWVLDKGWKMAKHIKPGDQLFTTANIFDLQQIEKGDVADVYNLEVGEFHTYFVGKNRVLVHDNTCPQPTTNRLPGVPGRKVVMNQVALQN